METKSFEFQTTVSQKTKGTVNLPHYRKGPAHFYAVTEKTVGNGSYASCIQVHNYEHCSHPSIKICHAELAFSEDTQEITAIEFNQIFTKTIKDLKANI
jgi:hypothetical protein